MIHIILPDRITCIHNFSHMSLTLKMLVVNAAEDFFTMLFFFQIKIIIVMFDSTQKMHSNEYKHALYLYSCSWDTP